MIYLFPLENKYALRSYFHFFGNDFVEDTSVLLIRGRNRSFLNITENTLHYSIVSEDVGLRYECYVNYEEFEIYSISEYIFFFDTTIMCWRQSVEMDNHEFINATRYFIREQLQNTFRRIESGWKETDFECLQSPMWYANMKSFHQACTPKTRGILMLYRKRLRDGVRVRKRANDNRLRKGFSGWKNWYFNPQNKEGYVRLFLKYDLRI